MVTIVDYKQRQNKEGENFFTLSLEGDLEMIRSQESGKFYATARKCSITSTFSEATCKGLIGKQLPGSIEKTQCDPYDYAIEETGETIQLDFTYLYNPDAASLEETVFEKKVPDNEVGVHA